MSEYSPENPDSVAVPNDAGLPATLTQASDSVPDSPGGDIFDVDFHLSLGRLVKSVDKLCAQNEQREQMRLAVQPNTVTWARQVQYTGAGFNSFGIADFGTPQLGRVWTVRAFAAAADGYEQGYLNTFPVLQTPQEPVYAEASGASTGVVSTALPVNFGGNANSSFKAAFVTSIQVTIGPAAAAGSTTVTLSGVEGGPFTWVISQSTTSSAQLIINFPAPGLPVIRGQQPTLTTSATVSGGTADVIIGGTYSASRASVLWYVGTPPQLVGAPAGSNLPFNPTPQLRDQMLSIPAYHTIAYQAIYVKPGDHLFALVFGAMESVDVMVTLDDQIDKSAKPSVLT